MMETFAVIVETIAVLFVFAWFGVGMVLRGKDCFAGWRKHWEAYRFWKSIRHGRIW